MKNFDLLFLTRADKLSFLKGLRQVKRKGFADEIDLRPNFGICLKAGKTTYREIKEILSELEKELESRQDFTKIRKLMEARLKNQRALRVFKIQILKLFKLK